jgi:arylsulfate sulfotransferase
MSFRTLHKSLYLRPPVANVRRPSRRSTRRLWVEALETRNLLAGFVTLTPNDDSLLVGEQVIWTAIATDVGSTPVYQFSAAPHGSPLRVVRDFSPAHTFEWTPMQEGSYDIVVTVKDGYQATEIASAVVSDEVASQVNGPQAVITATQNPLVAMYSVPPSLADTVFVQFAVAGDDPDWRNTDLRAVSPETSTNVFVAGMLPSTTYQMRHVLSDGSGSEPVLFTTGNIPATLAFPTYTVSQPAGPESNTEQDMIFHLSARQPGVVPNPFATDLQGRVTWYYDPTPSGLNFTFPIQSLASGGTVLLTGIDPYTSLPTSRNVLREIDLAGNPIRETNLAAINAQLAALGHEDVVHSFTNDVQRLPNGHTATIGITQRTIDVNGTPTDYNGMSIVVLDADLQVAWVWNSFDHMDVNRPPVLGEIVQPSTTGPSTAVPRLPSVDWLHINGVSWSPADGNLVLSVRHQDWVVKIDYAYGEGDGHVVWRLGEGGDFTLNSADPTAWFSHQHNAHFIDDNTLILLDNGNTRRTTDPTANSRGQVWEIDEQTMTATPVLNADLGSWAGAVGSAQRLSNGNYAFTLGINGPEPPRPPAHLIEVAPDGTKVFDLMVNKTEYRSYRVRTLYEGIDDAVAGAPQQVESVIVNDGSAQRSMVNQITVTFDGAAILDPGAIELRRQDGSLVGAQLSIFLVDGKTAALLTFAGPEFVGGSLADGSYTLTVRADRVHDRWGRQLDGDGDDSAGGNHVDDVFRLFGDSDGDSDVDLYDLGRFVSTLGRRPGDPHYLWYMDWNGDDRVGLLDVLAFAHRIGSQSIS